jgi:flagellin-specific chaperone FliS
MNKVLVKIYLPLAEEKYEVWLPLNKKIYNIIIILSKTLDELKEIEDFKNMPSLYNKYTGKCYDINTEIKDTDIRNGSELILI